MIPEYKIMDGVPRSKCPACERFVNEGSNHKCKGGRDRNPFINPRRDPEPWVKGKKK